MTKDEFDQKVLHLLAKGDYINTEMVKEIAKLRDEYCIICCIK